MVHLFMRAGLKQKRHVEDDHLVVLMCRGKIAAILFDQRVHKTFDFQKKVRRFFDFYFQSIFTDSALYDCVRYQLSGVQQQHRPGNRAFLRRHPRPRPETQTPQTSWLLSISPSRWSPSARSKLALWSPQHFPTQILIDLGTLAEPTFKPGYSLMQ